MNLKQVVALIFIVLFSFNLWGKNINIYVSANGDDKAPGTKDQPLASLYGARDFIRQLRETNNLQEEIQVIISGGIYYMTEPVVFTDIDSGGDNAPIVFKAAKGEEPVFVGGIAIENWEKVSDNLWKAKVPEVSRYGLYFEQLYVDGKRAVRAKSPNSGFYFLKEVDETIIEKGTGRRAALAVQKLKLFPSAASHFASFTSSDFNDALITFYHKWDNTRKRVSSFSADSAAVFTVGGGMKPWNKLDNKTRFTIDNYKAGLDSCGEWFLERSGDLYYIPREGEDLNNVSVYAPVTDQFLVIKGSKGKEVRNIRFENIRFEVAGYRTPLWGNEPVQAAAPVEAVVMLDYAKNIDFVNCGISQIGTNAFWFRKACDNCSVSQSYIHDLGAGGIKVGDNKLPDNEEDLTRNITVDNNIIRSGGFIFPCAVGVAIFHASDNKISHNEIADFRYTGISVGWVWGYAYSPTKRNTIEYNHIHHLGWGVLSDMGGIYTLGESEGTRVSNNVVHHVYSHGYGGWGLYTDEGSTGIVMENNLVYACKSAGFHQHYGKENIIKNNIFAFNQLRGIQVSKVEKHLSYTFTNNIVYQNEGKIISDVWGGDNGTKIKINIDHNCYWKINEPHPKFYGLSFDEWKESGRDENSIIADPCFADPQNFDFRIKNKSVVKKIGFKPFDVSNAGVYGSKAWKELAKFDPQLAGKFDRVVEELKQKTDSKE
ncbi:right-handed parallel beta-helix repeat-containing protein [Thermophagus sp. OGC60D27]|uniref:right-handed parallel beta-helix repeat-containing protein n=1 Tax=Thermophagus sp. OGC60D27 TaxID=3458415 RepID=UPI004037F7C1